MDAKTLSHQEIVKNLLTSKAVDFAAIGKAVAELGPALSVADEPWDFFCGTMRTFVHVYKINNPGKPLENLGSLNKEAGPLGG